MAASYALIVKVKKHTKLSDIELTWYPVIATHQIFFYHLQHGLGIHSFNITWTCLIVQVLATRAKILKPSGYSPVIIWDYTFRATNILAVIEELWPISMSKSISSRIRQCLFKWHSNNTRSEAMHNVSAHQLLKYYQRNWVPITAWTALVMWCTHLVGALVGLVSLFNGISISVHYLMPKPSF